MQSIRPGTWNSPDADPASRRRRNLPIRAARVPGHAVLAGLAATALYATLHATPALSQSAADAPVHAPVDAPAVASTNASRDGVTSSPGLARPAARATEDEFALSLEDSLGVLDLRTGSAPILADGESSAIDFGFSYMHGRGHVGGREHSGLRGVSPSAGYTVTDHWYANLRYSGLSKSFPDDSTRDGWSNSLSFDNYVFFQQKRSYFSIGYRIEDENTEEAQRDHLGHFFHARVKVAVPVERLSHLNPTVSTGLQYGLLAYDNVTPSIGEKREETRKSFNAALTVDITDPVFGTFSYKYVDSISNLPASDYDEQVVTLRLGFRF